MAPSNQHHSSMPPFSTDDASKLWQNIGYNRDCSPWLPEFLYCGPYDYKLQAFPVLSMTRGNYIRIPVESKFAFRFLNHVIYCMWHTSLDKRLQDGVRQYVLRVGKYAERLRSGFLDEVLKYWYTPGTQLPTNEEPARQDHPLRSCYLTSFLVNMFNGDSVYPPSGASRRPDGWKSDPATFGTPITVVYDTLDG